MRPLVGSYPYIYVDGVYLKRSWCGETPNVSILAGIGVGNDGSREMEGIYQRCTIHFYRNIFSVTPRNKMKAAPLMSTDTHAQESKEAAREIVPGCWKTVGNEA